MGEIDVARFELPSLAERVMNDGSDPVALSVMAYVDVFTHEVPQARISTVSAVVVPVDAATIVIVVKSKFDSVLLTRTCLVAGEAGAVHLCFLQSQVAAVTVTLTA